MTPMTIAEVRRVDAERKHLEGLLKDRIHFYLVFSSLFMLGLTSGGNDKVRVAALTTMTIISLLMSLAILRTHLLVGKALAEIINSNCGHPYERYQKEITFPGNANNVLVVVPFILTAFFLGTTIFYFGLLS